MRQAARGLGLLLLAGGCAHRVAGGPPRVPVAVAQVGRAPVPFDLVTTGSAEPLQTVAVQSQVTGVLSAVTFAEGAEVTAGEPLFQIDPRPFQAALDQARATLVRDSAQAVSADADAKRWADLVRLDYVTQSDADAKAAAAASANAVVSADSAALASAALNLQWATIRAPISGRTGRLLLRLGNLVRANMDQLVVINQIHPILVQFALPERFLPQIQQYRRSPQLSVLVTGSDADTSVREGALTFLDNAVDSTTGTVLLKAEFANRDNALWPGQFLNVRLRLYVEPQALVVPAEAVMTGQAGTYVFVVNPDGTARSQPVTIERTAGQTAVVAQGLEVGDQVVTDGQSRLVAGAHVEIKGSGAPPGQGDR